MDSFSSAEDTELSDTEDKVNAAADHVCCLIDHCHEAMHLLHSMDQAVVECGCYGSLGNLEDQILKAACSPEAVQALLYVAVIHHENHYLIRYLESGSQVRGFTKVQAKAFLEADLQVDGFLLPVYTEDDIARKTRDMKSNQQKRSMAQKTKPSTSKNRSRIGEKWKRLKDGESSKSPSSLNACYLDAKAAMAKCGHIVRIVVVARRINGDALNPSHRYQVAHGFEDNVSTLKQVQGLLDDFSTQGITGNANHLKHLVECQDPPTSLSEQFEMLGCLSNYHWGSRPRHSRSGYTSGQPHIPMICHYSFTPEWGEEIQGTSSTGHLPNSPRNLIVYYCVSANADVDKACCNIKHMLRPISWNPFSLEDVDMSNILPQPKRRRITNNRQECPTGFLTYDSNMSDSIEPQLFSTFVQHMTSDEAILCWIVHDSSTDIFVMSDMDAQTGAIKPSGVVHVKRNQFDAHVKYTCSCHVFQHVKGKELCAAAVDPDASGVFLPSTCAHCRFLRECIEENIATVISHGVIQTKMEKILYKSSECLNVKVIPVGKHSPQTVAKFSVSPGSGVDPAFVHISRHGFISCQSGECGARPSVTRSIKKLASLLKSKALCPHLACVAEAPDDVVEIALQRQATSEDHNDDDDIFEELDNTGSKLFNVASGMWEIPALSTHIPSREGPKLNLISFEDILRVAAKHCKMATHTTGGQDKGVWQRAVDVVNKTPSSIRERLRLVCKETVLENGFICGADVMPKVPHSCQCGAGFDETLRPAEADGVRIFYTRNAAVKCRSFKLTCRGGNCHVQYTGESDSIFFLTSQSGVCDEVGWDFVSRITTSKSSFTSFCADMTRVYKSNDSCSRSFVSRSTFVSWFFAWLAAFKIDFRKDVDVECMSTRNFLACDGTHVGVSLTNLNVSPIECPTEPDLLKDPMHKRNDRVLLFYPLGSSKVLQEDIRASRKYLRVMSCKTLGIPVQEEYTDEERVLKTDLLLNVCPQDEGCKDMIDSFLKDNHMPANIQFHFANIFYILSGDAAVSTFLPFRYLTHILSVCEDLDDAAVPRAAILIDEVREYCPEMADLLRDSLGTPYLQTVLCFIEYLISFVKKIHALDEPCEPAVPIPGTYDPESGIAYYFTEHGCRVRELPSYTLNATRHQHDVFDDVPDHDICNKLQAKVSPGGYNYTFFWFCPIHGHCLGFHLMPGAEGRKDPFSSLFQYLPNAPQEVFYDFACSFSEYSLNREPEYFRTTRFWHDLFHGFSHKCPPSLRSSRIDSLDILDTEICEQFNAFLQNIKYTGSHLSQSHFCLYLQFMIHIWNRRKNERWQNMDNIAAAVNTVDD